MTCMNCEAALTSPQGVSLSKCPFCGVDNNVIPLLPTGEKEAKLYKEIKAKGQEAYKDSNFLINLVSDIFSDNIKLKSTLRIIINEDVATTLANVLSVDELQQKLVVSKVVTYLSEECGIELSRASEAVQTLGLGLGLPEDMLRVIEADVPAVKSSHGITTPGSIIRFGKYDWRVLVVHQYKALILADRVIKKKMKKLSSHKDGYYTWENCTVRKYLNGKFYNDTFNKEEKSRIADTNVITRSSKILHFKGGNDTIDKIFLLSIEEVIKYLGDSGNYCSDDNDEITVADLKNAKTKVVEGKGLLIPDLYDGALKALDHDGATFWWTLRSPGNSLGNSSWFPSRVTSDGYVDLNGLFNIRLECDNVGIRPALWLNL